eukprot:NODE_2280_length_1242_cov_22.175189_g2076_i0.p1 GENE.NODE_2280_length_1242_cov_22.175189_g2076_i0~~NODE_2280_length_1242_cov_22.175189_g2076_i0.p1  ORF type:complete len:319 (-),score=66.74 NODE_2280_length_1242_cov_22.175189_g2076_i0:285-1169(-)
MSLMVTWFYWIVFILCGVGLYFVTFTSVTQQTLAYPHGKTWEHLGYPFLGSVLPGVAMAMSGTVGLLSFMHVALASAFPSASGAWLRGMFKTMLCVQSFLNAVALFLSYWYIFTIRLDEAAQISIPLWLVQGAALVPILQVFGVLVHTPHLFASFMYSYLFALVVGIPFNLYFPCVRAVCNIPDVSWGTRGGCAPQAHSSLNSVMLWKSVPTALFVVVNIAVAWFGTVETAGACPLSHVGVMLGANTLIPLLCVLSLFFTMGRTALERRTPLNLKSIKGEATWQAGANYSTFEV